MLFIRILAAAAVVVCAVCALAIALQACSAITLNILKYITGTYLVGLLQLTFPLFQQMALVNASVCTICLLFHLFIAWCFINVFA